jgi:plastocyanin
LPARAGHRGREEARNEIRGIQGKSSVVLSVLLVALAVLASACAGGGSTIRLADGQRASAHGEADVAGTPGQRLTVTLSNQGNSLHDFRIAAQHIDAGVEAGTPVTVTVTFPEKGAVTFECRYHLLQNMRGELVSGGGE